MARRLRMQYPGARYHVINRGYLPHDVFATFGAKNALDAALKEGGKSWADAESAPKGVGWKVAIARKLRTTVAAPYRWIATTLKMGHPAAVRGYLSQRTLQSAD